MEEHSRQISVIFQQALRRWGVGRETPFAHWDKEQVSNCLCCSSFSTWLPPKFLTCLVLHASVLLCFLQGILTAQDAVSAVEAGASGVIVSNHGGRALDGSLSSIESLAPVVKVSLSIPSMNRMRKR